jgi:hypothetical protein
MKEGMLGMSAKTVKPVEGSATSARDTVCVLGTMLGYREVR